MIPMLFSHMGFLKKEIAKEHRKEEEFWKQKSREKWLQLGDMNSKKFHASVKSTRIRNHLHFLVDEQGNEHKSKGSKGEVAAVYFQNFFTSTNPSGFEDILDGFQPRA